MSVQSINVCSGLSSRTWVGWITTVILAALAVTAALSQTVTVQAASVVGPGAGSPVVAAQAATPTLSVRGKVAPAPGTTASVNVQAGGQPAQVAAPPLVPHAQVAIAASTGTQVNATAPVPVAQVHVATPPVPQVTVTASAPTPVAQVQAATSSGIQVNVAATVPAASVQVQAEAPPRTQVNVTATAPAVQVQAQVPSAVPTGAQVSVTAITRAPHVPVQPQGPSGTRVKATMGAPAPRIHVQTIPVPATSTAPASPTTALGGVPTGFAVVGGPSDPVVAADAFDQAPPTLALSDPRSVVGSGPGPGTFTSGPPPAGIPATWHSSQSKYPSAQPSLPLSGVFSGTVSSARANPGLAILALLLAAGALTALWRRPWARSRRS